MNFRFPIDRNIQLNPLDSEVIKIIQDHNIQDTIFDVNFYGYDGDGLIGRVTGLLEIQLIDNGWTLNYWNCIYIKFTYNFVYISHRINTWYCNGFCNKIL